MKLNKQTLKNFTTCTIATVLAISFLVYADKYYSTEVPVEHVVPVETPIDCIAPSQVLELTLTANELSKSVSELTTAVDNLSNRMDTVETNQEVN